MSEIQLRAILAAILLSGHTSSSTVSEVDARDAVEGADTILTATVRQMTGQQPISRNHATKNATGGA
jgi:RecA-family ATPase